MLEFLAENQWIFITALAYISYKIGWKMHEAWFLYIIQEHPERIQAALDLTGKLKNLSDEEALDVLKNIKDSRTAEADAVKLSIEKVGSEFYAYIKDAGTFVAQGASMEDVITRAQKRYPGKKFIGELAQSNSTN
jgi:hypothetical protein